jgi:hypothetical protein
MGLIPSTGSEISIGKVAAALGLITGSNTAAAGMNIGLNSSLGVGRNRASTVIASITSGSQTIESSDFGGLSTPQDYV